MNSACQKDHAGGMLQHLPASFFVMAALTLVSAFWLRAPWSYLASSVGVGVVWLALLAWAWRLRSGVATIAASVVVLTAHHLLRAWLVPSSLFTLAQGLLVTGC